MTAPKIAPGAASATTHPLLAFLAPHLAAAADAVQAKAPPAARVQGQSVPQMSFAIVNPGTPFR